MSSVPLPPHVPAYYPKVLDPSLRDDYYQQLWLEALEQPDANPRSLPVAAMSAVRRGQGHLMASRMWSAAPLREVPCSGQVRYEDASHDRAVVPASEHDIVRSTRLHADRLKRMLPVCDWGFVDHVVFGKPLPKPMSPPAKSRARARILKTIEHLVDRDFETAESIREIFTTGTRRRDF